MVGKVAADAATSDGVSSGVYCPPDYQTNPAAITRLALVTPTTYHVFNHHDPRRGGQGIHYLSTVPLMADLAEGPAAWGAAIARVTLWSDAQVVWLVLRDTAGAAARDLRAHWPAVAAGILNESANGAFSAHELTSDGQLAGLILRKRGANGRETGPVIPLYAPWVNDAWGIWEPLQRLPKRDIAEGLALAAFALGMQLRFSPSTVGALMLRQELHTWETRNGALPTLSPAWRERLAGELRPSYALWRAPLTPAALLDAQDGQLTLHAFDRNSSFVSSAREVGVGDPLPTTTFRPGRPGVYFVTRWDATHLPDYGLTLPGPFRVASEDGSQESYPLWGRHLPGGGVWAWEPQIRHALKWQFDLTIAEGFYWPKRGDLPDQPRVGHTHDLFRGWQQRFWEARRVARQWGHGSELSAGTLAETIIKRAGVSAIGRLNKGRGHQVMATATARRLGYRILRRETDAAGELTGQAEVEVDPALSAAPGALDLLQPGWWATIISNANERLWHALYTHASGDTLLAYEDGLYTLEPHPPLCGPRDQPGGWRSQGSFTVPLDGPDGLATCDDLAPRELVKRLAQWKRQNAPVDAPAANLTAQGVEDGQE